MSKMSLLYSRDDIQMFNLGESFVVETRKTKEAGRGRYMPPIVYSVISTLTKRLSSFSFCLIETKICFLLFLLIFSPIIIVINTA